MKLRLNSRHLLLLTYLLSVSTALLAQGPPSYVPSNGLVGWWPFTGNAIDSSSNGNNGTVTGATPTTDRFGRSNGAYSFDGNADYINCGNASSLSISGSITLSVWIYANNFNTDHGIISKYNNGASYDLITGAPYSLAPLNKIRWMDLGGFLYSGPINSGTWYHLVTVTDLINQKKYIYLNGNLVAQSNINLSSISTNNYNLYIGAHLPTQISTWSWDGKLDDVGIWNRALDECEIKSLYLSNTYNRPTLSIGKDSNYCKLDSVKLTASTGFKSYLWSTNDTSRSIYIKSTQKLSVVATDSLGCKAYDTVTISLLNPKISPRDTVVCKGSQVTLSNTTNTSNSNCGYMPSSLKSGLVAWYPFCGNASDQSGNNNNGNVFGATTTTDRFGKSNSAYLFNGTSDYIQISLASISNTIPANSEFTSSVWVKTADQNGPVISIQGNNGIEYDFHIGTLADIVQSAGRYGILVRDNCCGTGNNIFGSSVADNGWHMLTIVRTSNGTLKLYKDGVLDATSGAGQSGQLAFHPTYMNIGADRAWVVGSGQGCNSCNSNNQQHLNGVIDDAGFWNRALSSTEISQLYSIQNQSSLSFSWSTSDTTSTTKITANANRQVWLKATDGIGNCYDTTMVYTRQASVSIGTDTIRVCRKDSVLLRATKGFKNYLWSNGAKSDSIFVKNSSKITLKAIDSIGCQDNDTSVVSILNPKISPRDTVVCKSSQVTLRGSINSASSSNTTCGYMPYALKSGLVAWYPFCGNANDESGNGNHGTVNGATLSTDRFGNSGKAYSFDGVNDYIIANGTSQMQSSNLSISIWCKFDNVNSFTGTLITLGSSSSSLWGPYYNYLQPGFGFGTGLGCGGSFNGLNYSLNSNTWVNLTVIRQGNAINIYVNGSYLGTTNNSFGGSCNSSNLFFGVDIFSVAEYFKGNLDDIGIWNRALTAAEVAELYTLQSVAYPPKLSWSTSDTTTTTKITPLATTKLWLKASNGIGTCYDTTSVIVSKPVINLQDTILFTNCKRDSMLVNIGSAWKSVNWSNGGNDSTTWLKTSGNYFVSAKDQYGCAATDSTYFVNPGQPKISLIVADSVNCFGGKDGSLSATAAGGYAPVRYLWNDAAKQSTSKASGLTKGTYKLLFYDAYNCKDSAIATVSEPNKLLLSLASSDSVNCFGGSDGSLKVTATGGNGGNNYQWNDLNTQKTSTATNLKAGIYKVTVNDIYGCADTLTASVKQPLKVVAGISNFKNAKCFGYSDGSALGTGSGGTGSLSYKWNTSPVQNTAQASGLSKGIYLLTVTDVYGCYDTISSNISEPAKIDPIISANRLAVRDIPHQLNSTVAPVQTYTYQWTPGSVFGSSTNKPAINGKFQTTTLVTLRTTDNNGCFGEDTATITVLIPFGDFIPTVFSPNADKHNDVFGLPDIFEIEQMDIYNRWGELLFSGSATNPNWDGLYKGEFVPQGTYVYMIKASLKGTDYKFEHHGTISVVR